MEDVNKVFCKLYIYSNENSKSKDTGAITVDGGVGIKKDLCVGGKIISKNMNITKKLSLSCNLTAKNTNLSLGEPDARFKGYFNEINSNIINNNSKINTSHLVVKNKLEICNNGNICFNVDKQNISIYGDSYIINAPTYNHNYTYHFQPVVFNNHIIVKPELVNTKEVIDNLAYKISSSLILLTIDHKGIKNFKLDTTDMPNYCKIKISCIYKIENSTLIFNTGTKNYNFENNDDSIEVILINGVFFKI